MPSMPTYFIGKGSQFGVLDGRYDGSDPAAYRDAQARLENEEQSLAGLARERYAGRGLVDKDLEHFEHDWLDQWWRNKQVGRVLRQGFLTALRIAQEDDPEHPLPIEGLWVCADEKSFHVYVNKGPHQVTVLVFTPPPAAHVPVDVLTEQEDIWVVKPEDDHDRGYWPDEIEQRAERRGSNEPRIIERRIRYAPVGDTP
jgi:hypothetical protein